MLFFLSLAGDYNMCLLPGVRNYLDAWKMLVFSLAPDGKSADHIQTKSHPSFTYSHMAVASLGSWYPYCADKKGFFSKRSSNETCMHTKSSNREDCLRILCNLHAWRFSSQTGWSPEQSGLTWSWLCCEQKVGQETSWGPFQPNYSAIPTLLIC